MQLPAYYLKQPAADWGAETLASFERLYAEAVAPGNGTEIAYTLPAPKWQFLCHLCDHKGVVLHGSGSPNIIEFEPRQSNDVIAFGNRRAAYAASDGIWPLYFAIVDRERYVTSLVNSCFRIIEAAERSAPYYFFSINGDALPYVPWREGTIYLLPGDSFEQQPRQHSRGVEIELAQWASLDTGEASGETLRRAGGFPLSGATRPHDPAALRERALADPEGFPWLEE